jgi:hypothetical protein
MDVLFTRRSSDRWLLLSMPASAFLALTAVISLLWSHYKILWLDEIFELWTDSCPTIGQVFKVQYSYPISLDPLAYHAIAHGAIWIFGANPFSIRIPSLLGYLTLQICLFVFVWRIANERAGFLALVLPSFTTAIYFSTEGRPYGMMLGLLGLAMVSWQTATRSQSKRTGALIGLALALALIPNLHYSGVLLLAPFFIAELFRVFQRRKLDFPVLCAMFIGAAGIGFMFPFTKAAAEFRTGFEYPHSPEIILQTYLWMLFKPILSHGIQVFSLGLTALFFVIVCVGLSAFVEQWRKRDLALPDAEVVFLIALAALPIFSFLLTTFVTRFVSERYGLGAIVGISSLVAIGLSSYVKKDRPWRLVVAMSFIAMLAAGADYISAASISAQQQKNSLNITPNIKGALLADRSRYLYFQSIGPFAFASYYEPDPEIKSRIALVYSKEQELRWSGLTIASLTALHLRNFTHFNITAYESFLAQCGDNLFVDNSTSADQVTKDWSWIGRTLAEAHADVKPYNSGFGGEVKSVRFSSETCDARK